MQAVALKKVYDRGQKVNSPNTTTNKTLMQNYSDYQGVTTSSGLNPPPPPPIMAEKGVVFFLKYIL